MTRLHELFYRGYLENPVAYMNGLFPLFMGPRPPHPEEVREHISLTVRDYLRQLLLESPIRWYPPGAYEEAMDAMKTYLRPLSYLETPLS
jgi:hypothetical protein